MNETMQAVVVSRFGGPEVLEVVQAAKPVPGPKQVLIKVEATSLNFADIKSRYGNKGAKQPPFIPGLDVAGIIETIGSEVDELHIGQRVIAFPAGGSYAEYVTAEAILTFAVPDTIDMASAAASPIVSFTSYKLLADVARLAPGETVLIHAAAGGVGTTSVQLAKRLGAGQVIGTASSSAKAKIAMQAGADYVVNTSEEDFVKTVLARTDGMGADVILDSIGGKITEQGMQCLAPYGRLVQFGNASGEYANIHTKDLHASCLSVLGLSLGTTRAQRPYLLRGIADQVLRYLATGDLRMMIGRRFALEDAKIAHELVEGRGSTGKVLLVPATSELRSSIDSWKIME
jgi:NADPH2:quinone reductase